MRLFPGAAALLLLTSCGPDDGDPLRLQATVAFPPRDTISFALPARIRRCADGQSLLLEAVSPQGNGVLAHLRFGDSLKAGSYPMAPPGDSVTVPSAAVAVRYMLRDVGRGFAVDSGLVRVTYNGEALSAHIEGSGLESAIRTPTWIDFRDVPLSARTDTVPCKYQP